MKSRLFLLLMLFAFLSACQPKQSSTAPAIKKGMIKVTIFYPSGEGKTFDMDYYVNNHFPLLRKELGDSLKFTAIDKGLTGRTPEDALPYVAIGYLYFETLSSYQNSMAAHGEPIRADVPKYTNIQPLIQISEVIE